MATKTTTGKKKASRPRSKSAGKAIPEILGVLGVDDAMMQSMVENWKGQLNSKVTSSIQEADLKVAYDKARELASGSASKLKTYAKSNPSMVYSGLAAVLVGAGLLAAAAKQATDEKKPGSRPKPAKSGSTSKAPKTRK